MHPRRHDLSGTPFLIPVLEETRTANRPPIVSIEKRSDDIDEGPTRTQAQRERSDS